jgi:hypothetical protein
MRVGVVVHTGPSDAAGDVDVGDPVERQAVQHGHRRGHVAAQVTQHHRARELAAFAQHRPQRQRRAIGQAQVERQLALGLRHAQQAARAQLGAQCIGDLLDPHSSLP